MMHEKATTKILVTGGTGYIGSHTAVALIEAGYEVVLIDNLSNSFGWVAGRICEITGRKVTLEVVDLTDRDALDECMARHYGAAAVIHFAALKSVGESVKMPLRYYHNNISGLLNLIAAMIRNSIPDLVFSSSCTVYGASEILPVTETTPLQPPLSPYGATKRMAEEIITDVTAAGHLRAILLRYFNPVGAHPSAQIGELPMGVPDNLMPYITQTAIGKRGVLKVFGNDYPTPDGTPVRDYIHVSDLAAAHLKAIERMIKGKQRRNTEVYNLGAGKGFSVMEIIHAFETYNKVKVPFEITGRRPGDITAIWADPALAAAELNWHARLGIREMVTSAWEWEKKLKEHPFDPENPDQK